MIDLTGENDDHRAVVQEEKESFDSECSICSDQRVPGGVTYNCCEQFCCLDCFRRMHVQRQMEYCPFCRALVDVEMDLIQLHWQCSDGTRGSVWISPADPLKRLAQLIPDSPSWTPKQLAVSGLASLRAPVRIVLLDNTPLFMNDLVAHGERFAVLFGCQGSLLY